MKFDAFFQEKLKYDDLILAKIVTYVGQRGTALIGKVYRAHHAFPEMSLASIPNEIQFIGAGPAWGQVPNYSGEICLMFLSKRDSFRQNDWQGHIPIFLHENELVCQLNGLKLWEMDGVPDLIRSRVIPDPQRKNSKGENFASLVPFSILENFFIEMICRIEGKDIAPLEVRPIITSGRLILPP
jgi:hypothetical protein